MLLRFGDQRGQRLDAKHKSCRVACELSAASEISTWRSKGKEEIKKKNFLFHCHNHSRLLHSIEHVVCCCYYSSEVVPRKRGTLTLTRGCLEVPLEPDASGVQPGSEFPSRTFLRECVPTELRAGYLGARLRLESGSRLLLITSKA